MALKGLPASVLAADGPLDGLPVRWIAVVPDSNARFARARSGEVGIDEGFAIATAVAGTPAGRPIVAIVDVPGQAFGIREEAIGLQRSLAAATNAYAIARRSGHAVVALIVGKAISGAFIAHGLQAGWIGAIDAAGTEVHVMSAAAAARVTRMSREDIDRIAGEIPATARDIESFARFGAIDALFSVADAGHPGDAEVAEIARALATAVRDPLLGRREPRERLRARAAEKTRALSRRVRELLADEWDV